MKLEQKQKAIALRKKGLSISSIASELHVSKSSVSTWVRDVEMSKNILDKIRSRSHTAAVVERRRMTRIKKEEAYRSDIIRKAKSEIRHLSPEELLLVGTALYWGEGSKKKRGMVEFTNSDPRMIKFMKYFLREVCAVPEDKFRGHVYLHAHLSPHKAEAYWSGVSNIPLTQFHKTSIQKNKKKLQKDTLPFGTFAIVVCDTKLKLTIMGWIEGLGELF